jgi:hypothetical protein
MDAFHTLVALSPLALYLLGLAAINLRGRPMVTTGLRDIVALGIALCGFVVVGPMELFLPDGAVAVFGTWTWVIMVGFYSACVLFIALSMRPRLVVYNITPERLHAILAPVALSVDGESRWAGASLLLPQVGVHLQMEPFRAMKCVSLVSVGPRQNLDGWSAVNDQLTAALAEEHTGANPRGYSLLSFALVMIGMMTWKVWEDPVAVTDQFRDFLRM